MTVCLSEQIYRCFLFILFHFSVSWFLTRSQATGGYLYQCLTSPVSLHILSNRLVTWTFTNQQQRYIVTIANKFLKIGQQTETNYNQFGELAARTQKIG